MASKKFQREKKLTLTQQKIAIERKYNKSIINCDIEKGVLKCRQRVKPTDISREYEITLEYKIPKSPVVYLINQGLMKDSEEILPHCYERKFYDGNKERVQLCLFYSKCAEWNGTMFLADTIVPWAIEWLYYYEQWRMTGEWYGGGEHPKQKKHRTRHSVFCK